MNLWVGRLSWGIFLGGFKKEIGNIKENRYRKYISVNIYILKVL